MSFVVNAMGHLIAAAAQLSRAPWSRLAQVFEFIASRTDDGHGNYGCAALLSLLLAAFLGTSPTTAVAQTAAPSTARPDEIAPGNRLSPLSPNSIRREPIPPEQVVAIPPALLERLQHEVIAPTRSRNKRLDLLVQLLFEPTGLALQYDGTRTRTIAESTAEGKINCLTFALLFTALARHAGIDAYVQETDQVLVGNQEGVLYGNGHVNVSASISGTRKTVDIDQSVMAVHGETRRVSDDRALSHFYNNRGAELMEAGELDAARRHFEMALRVTPDFVAAWNNFGVLNMRERRIEEAERSYEKALEQKPNHTPALSNMIKLYRLTGESRRQAEFEKRLFRVQSKDPFQQLILAMGYEQKGDYSRALNNYRRALRLHGSGDYIHFGMARAYAHLGDIPSATEELRYAREAAGDRNNRYQAKLDHLKRLHEP